ncbi:MAG: S8 family serine peptidase [Oscillospiraceae bacterium]|nr:S8 family serine peptidase [Oscillospiraceae bacterium]
MKHFKCVLALLLALVMVLSCFGTAFAAESEGFSGKTPLSELARDKSQQKSLKGFKSESFQMNNTYRYADDEIVRVIVILEGQSEAEVGESGSTKAASQRVKLVNQHNGIFKKMAHMDYELKYEFTRLLNGFSCEVAYGRLEEISAMEGVEAVYLANRYDAPVLQSIPETKQPNANVTTGNIWMHGSGWDGYGTVVAVLDTGLTLDHEAFRYNPSFVDDTVLTEEKVAAAELNVDGVFVSPKVPFAYDYADMDQDVTDVNGHGTHVSGTAAGMACSPVENGGGWNIYFTGSAPAAQLLSMKVFSSQGGGTYSDIYFYAMEDAYTLGADVINMSLGAPSGFTYDDGLETEVFGNIFRTLSDAGVILSIAGGNEYSMADFASSYGGYLYAIGPEYTDYGTIASPATYEGNVSVASLENALYPDWAIQIDGEENIAAYADSCEDGEHGWVQNFGGKSVTYQIVLDAEGNISLGTEEDFAAYEEGTLEGKIAIVSRGEIDFETKVENAAKAGAIGCIVVNNDTGIILMSIETFEIPAISLQKSALSLLSVTGTIYTPEDIGNVPNPNGGLMSDFSNWGTSPMLTLDPAITSIGGMVYSSVPGGTDTYEIYSGTSMAAPNMTGTFANLISAIRDINGENEIEQSKAETAELAKDLMFSSAELLYDGDGLLYSPRKQGAGLGNAYEAAWNYKESAYLTNPLQELGDDAEKTGVYTMTLEVRNDSEYSLYYTDFETYVMTDALEEEEETLFNTLSSTYLYAGTQGEDATVSYKVNGEEVTELNIEPYSNLEVEVTITLTEEVKAALDQLYPNGAFVEGYVIFQEYHEGELWSQLHATYLAYYGDWTQAPVLEESDWRDIIPIDTFLNTTPADEEGNTYADYGYAWYNSGMLDFYTNPKMAYITDATLENPVAYAGDNMLEYLPYYDEHIAFSTPESDGSYYYGEAIYMEPFQLRNARHLIMTVTDKESGEVYYVDDTEYLPKAFFDMDYGAWLSTGVFAWDGTDAEGNYVPSGTVATISYDAVLPYGEALQEDIWGFDVTVDYTAPTLDEIVLDNEANTITVTATDENYLQAIYLTDMDYNILDAAAYSSDVKGETFTATFDISELRQKYGEIYVTALDYATNEMEEYLQIFELGLDATITLVTPYGEKTIETVTGETFTFAAGPAVENCDFYFWTDRPIENMDFYTLLDSGAAMYFEGDEWLVVGDATYYALYGVGEYISYETPNYYYYQAEDYSGQWAICGWDVDEEGYYITGDPAALNSRGEVIRVAGLEDAVIGDYFTEFYTASQEILYTIAKTGDGLYTIQSSTGKYLALAEGALTLADEVSPAATWSISSSEYVGSLVYNGAETNLVLVYDYDAGEFAILDDSQPMDWILEYYGEIVYPSEYYSLPLYIRELGYVDVAYYSTMPPVSCLHTETELRNAKEATCTEDGYTGDTWCVLCETLLEEGQAIPATGHKTELRFAVEATCTKNGYTGDTYCLNCGELLAEGEVIPATGHSYEDGSCTVCGAEDPDFEKPCYFKTFSDCEAQWYHEAVDFMVSEGLMNGMGGDKFGPNTALSRAMVVTVLYRLMETPEVAEPSTFTDVPEGIWYSDAIAWAQDEGIVNGVTATTFAPDQDVTREQIATILWRFMGCPEAEADLSAFGDAASVSPYALDAIHWAVAEGIMNGDGKNLNPLNSATRAEFACMFTRMLDGEYRCKD